MALLYVMLWQFEMPPRTRVAQLRALSAQARRATTAPAPGRSAAPDCSSLMLAASNTLPDDAGYVAAAYLVFLALLLIYVGSWPTKLSRIERELDELNELADRARSRAAREGARAMSELLALGISHKTAPVARARAPRADRPPRPRRFLPRAASTTDGGPRGRRDLHLQPHRGLPRRGDPVEAETARARRALAQRAGIRPTELADAMYSPRNCDAARQLYRVASGLESMIVGEAEVQGQVKRAYEAALDAGDDRPADQPPLQRRAADRQARALRDRRSARGALSVSSVAVDLARERRRRPGRPRTS